MREMQIYRLVPVRTMITLSQKKPHHRLILNNRKMSLSMVETECIEILDICNRYNCVEMSVTNNRIIYG